MTNEYHMGCPQCSMSFGMSSVLSKEENGFKCVANPEHKFRLDENGFLKSV